MAERLKPAVLLELVLLLIYIDPLDFFFHVPLNELEFFFPCKTKGSRLLVSKLPKRKVAENRREIS